MSLHVNDIALRVCVQDKAHNMQEGRCVCAIVCIHLTLTVVLERRGFVAIAAMT